MDMSSFPASFPEGELAREIALRGLTQQEFANRAGLAEKTIAKAIRGKQLRGQSWGKIKLALATTPVPSELVEQSA